MIIGGGERRKGIAGERREQREMGRRRNGTSGKGEERRSGGKGGEKMEGKNKGKGVEYEESRIQSMKGEKMQ